MGSKDNTLPEGKTMTHFLSHCFTSFLLRQEKMTASCDVFTKKKCIILTVHSF